MMRLAPKLLFLFIASGGCEHSFVSSQSFPVEFPDCDIASYYSSLSSPPNQTSRDDMHMLIKDTHRNVLPYTSSFKPDVWDGLIALDTTDSSRQRIKLIYGEKNVTTEPRDAGSCDYWNREHVWPRKRGVGESGKDDTDLHHIRPADCNVNSARGRKYFAECGTVDKSSCMSPAHPEAADDTSKDKKSFLPPESKRGDIARMILYMDLRYDGDEKNTNNLVVSDCPEDVPNGAGMGYLSQLLQWHLDDPPTEEEKKRNEAICTNWQGNRNPFIDYPELAATYFGEPQPLPENGAGYNCTRPKLTRPGLIITGVIDGPRPGGFPKAVELHVTANIPDLSIYGVGFANNGNGSDGIEFTFPSENVTAGSFLTIAYEEKEFEAYFGSTPNFVSRKLTINGNDAIELFQDGQVVDVYGDVNVAGGEWNYMDGWSYRRDDSTPSTDFNPSDWTLSGSNAVDECSSNTECSSVFPAQSYKHSSTLPQPTEVCSAEECATNEAD